MPEGHTLHRLAGELSATFAGRAVRVTSPQGRFAESAALVDTSIVSGAEAWGKHLFIAFPGDRFVHVHLGLYGTFLVHPAVQEVPAPVGQVRMRLEAGAPGAASYAVRAAKEAIDRGLEVDLESGLEIERLQFAGVFATEDRTIGMGSFVENGPGKAVFTGR